MTAILTPTILGLTGFFALMSLSGSGISNFSVVALTSAFGTPLSVANLALTAYLSTQALGVLLGGFIADMTRRHAEVAALRLCGQRLHRAGDRHASGSTPLPLIVAMARRRALVGHDHAVARHAGARRRPGRRGRPHFRHRHLRVSASAA